MTHQSGGSIDSSARDEAAKTDSCGAWTPIFFATYFELGAIQMGIRARLRSKAAARPTRDVEAMLARYPRLTTDENARLLALLPSIPLLDTAIIMADEHLSKKLDGFYLAHRDAFAARWSRVLPVIIVLALSFLGLLSP